MTYIVHINPTPGSDLREVEVEAEGFSINSDGSLSFYRDNSKISDCTNDRVIFYGVACFSPAVWNYVEPKK